MRHALLLLLLLPRAGQEIPSHPDKLAYKPLNYEVPDPAKMRVKLSGAGTAYLMEDPAIPIVEIQIHLRPTGFEPRGKEGVAALTGALLRTGGTRTRAPEALDEEIEFLAADLSVSIGDTSGSVTLSVMAKDLGKGIEILADVLRNPAFRQDKLDTAKAQALERLKARNDSTAAIETRELDLLFYGPDYFLNRHPTAASVGSITREDLAEFHAANLVPANFVVAAAGAFRRDDLVARLEAAFKGWTARDGRPAAIPKPAHEAKPGIYCFHKPVNQGRVTIGHMGVDIHHPDVQAIRVASYIFGAGGFSSRLMQKVRTEEGLAYSVRSDFRPGLLYPWPFKIQFQSKSESCAYAAKLCLEELARFQKDGVTEKELGDARQFFLDGFPALFFGAASQTVNTWAQAELLGYPKDYYQTYREKIARLTPADIRRVAREHLKPGKFAWVVVGDTSAIKKGDGVHPVTLADLGTLVDVPLPDPLTLQRPPGGSKN